MTNFLTAIITCILTCRVTGRLLPKLFKKVPKEVSEDLVKHNFLSSTTSLWQVIYNSNISEEVNSDEHHPPTLCIHARNDNSAPFDAIRQLTELQTDWQLLSLDDSEHHPWLWDNLECQRVMNESIACWEQKYNKSETFTD